MQVVEAQAKLSELGLYQGQLDGWLGPLTRWAIQLFQRWIGAPETGELDDETADELAPPPIPERSLRPERPIPTRKTAQRWPREADAPGFYGAPGQNLKRLHLPFPVLLAWDKDTVIRSFYVHEKVHDSAERAFRKIAEVYSAAERRALGIDLYGGCLNVRKKRGGSTLSMHSWAIAIDFDPARNRLRWSKDRARLADQDAEPFWQAWEDEGWVSLGRERGYDFMHVQAARL